MRRIYYVRHEDTTHDEPRAGWYIGTPPDAEEDQITGPFSTQERAEDWLAEHGDEG